MEIIEVAVGEGFEVAPGVRVTVLGIVNGAAKLRIEAPEDVVVELRDSEELKS